MNVSDSFCQLVIWVDISSKDTTKRDDVLYFIEGCRKILQFDDQELDFFYDKNINAKAHPFSSFPPEVLKEATISESSDGAIG